MSKFMKKFHFNNQLRRLGMPYIQLNVCTKKKLNYIRPQNLYSFEFSINILLPDIVKFFN